MSGNTRRHIVVVAYDVSDDRRRDRLRTLLTDYGVAVNRSVFECELAAAELRRVAGLVGDVIHPTQDVVLFYPLCAKCLQKRQTAGKAPAVPSQGVMMIT